MCSTYTPDPRAVLGVWKLLPAPDAKDAKKANLASACALASAGAGVKLEAVLWASVHTQTFSSVKGALYFSELEKKAPSGNTTLRSDSSAAHAACVFRAWYLYRG